MRPLITPLDLRRRRGKRAILSLLAATLLLLLLLPTLLTQLIRYQLPKMGLGQVEIGNIDLNLFRGKLRLEEVELFRSAARVLSLRRADVDLAMLALFDGRIHLQSLVVDGLSITIRQSEGEPLQIAGYPLATAGEKAPAAGEGAGGWEFGIDELNISDSAVQVLHPRFSETVLFHRVHLGPLAMWRPDYITPLSFHLGMAGGELTVEAKSNPFALEPLHRVELNISSLPLADFSRLLQPTLAELEGELSSQMAIQLQQDALKNLSLKQQGSVSLSGLKLKSGETVLQQQGINWSGEAETDDLSDTQALRLKGELKLAGTGVAVEGRKVKALSMQGLTLSGLQLSGSKRLVLDEVAIDGLVTEVARTGQGVTLAVMPRTPPPAAGEQKAETKVPPATGDDEPFAFRIGRLHLGGESRISFSDQTVKPPFRYTLVVTEGELRHLDSSQPGQATTIKIKGKDDRYTALTVVGESRPFAQQLSLNLKAKLSAFDMPPASPYLAQLLGYRITTGQLDSDISMQIENEEMKGELELRMNQLQLDKEDPARIEEAESQMALPLNTALSLLRDKDDNIQLKLPISGRLDDPQFDMGDIINTALGKALKSGSVSYLKHLLQPYGSLITIVQLAGKAGGQIQLDPVRFAEGSAELGAEAADYIGKVSQLVEKGSINLRLCGVATVADLTAISGGKEKAIPPAGHPALEALARERAEAIKAELVNRYGAKPSQLFICHPELDGEAEAVARVELTI